MSFLDVYMLSESHIALCHVTFGHRYAKMGTYSIWHQLGLAMLLESLIALYHLVDIACECTSNIGTHNW